MWLARKIESKKWERISHSKDGSVVGADAVTTLRSKGQCLSFWEVSDITDQNQINETFVAICSTMENPDKVEIALLSKEALQNEFTVTQTPGETALLGVENRHYDMHTISGMDAVRLAELIMSNNIDVDSGIILKTKTDIIDLITEFHRQQRIKPAAVKGKMKALLEQNSKP